MSSPQPEPIRLPPGFLSGPAPNLTKSHIDWTLIPEYRDSWAVILDGVLTEEECETLVAAAEGTTNGEWERAMVNIGMGMQMVLEDTRNCGRIIVDDRDIVAKLWARIADAVPEIHRLENWSSVTGNGPVKRKEAWKVTRLNERMRFLKYVGGEYFKAHNDGSYETPDRQERSYFTLHLYLNDPAGKNGEEPLQGGSTIFYNSYMDREIEVEPKVGRVLLFQHRNLLHAGGDVVKGTKLTLRTDIMYTIDKES